MILRNFSRNEGSVNFRFYEWKWYVDGLNWVKWSSTGGRCRCFVLSKFRIKRSKSNTPFQKVVSADPRYLLQKLISIPKWSKKIIRILHWYRVLISKTVSESHFFKIFSFANAITRFFQENRVSSILRRGSWGKCSWTRWKLWFSRRVTLVNHCLRKTTF